MEEKVAELIQTLEDSTLMEEYLLAKQAVQEDRTLRKKIETFHENQDWSLRIEIMKDPNYLKYQEKENEIYYLTLEITRRLKELTGGPRKHENH